MRRFVPRRFRHSDEPPFDTTHQHKIPGPWPIVVLALIMLVIIGLIAAIFGQQAKTIETQRDMIEYMEGKGTFRDAESETTRELLCAVMPQLQADDAGILEQYAIDLGCPTGPTPVAQGVENPALPTPIGGAQPYSTGAPAPGRGSDTASASGRGVPRTGASAAPAPRIGSGTQAAPEAPGRSSAQAPAPVGDTPPQSAPTPPPPAASAPSPPSATPPESSDSGGVALEVDAGLKLCLPLLGCLDV